MLNNYKFGGLVVKYNKIGEISNVIYKWHVHFELTSQDM